ncbi:hypothetical protein DNTS_017136, partial [Danionella cerebrum]
MCPTGASMEHSVPLLQKRTRR